MNRDIQDFREGVFKLIWKEVEEGEIQYLEKIFWNQFIFELGYLDERRKKSKDRVYIKYYKVIYC